VGGATCGESSNPYTQNLQQLWFVQLFRFHASFFSFQETKTQGPKHIQVQGWLDHFDQRPSLWPWRLNICPSWDLNETKEIEKIMDKSDNKKGHNNRKHHYHLICDLGCPYYVPNRIKEQRDTISRIPWAPMFQLFAKEQHSISRLAWGPHIIWTVHLFSTSIAVAAAIAEACCQNKPLSSSSSWLFVATRYVLGRWFQKLGLTKFRTQI
jgi:hypothetical protein